ncbi:MAG: ferrous iron transport protein B [Flavobacteriales bacterium]
MKIALVGNPNCGKTTLFNRLTGRRAKVGNMPGVTVERSEAPFKFNPEFLLIDLPGTYSLFAQSGDEQVTQEAILNDKITPDAVWIILDSAHVRSSLFLALQVLEMGIPAVLIINQTDQSTIHLNLLSDWLGVPAIALNFEKDRADQMHKALSILQPEVSSHRVPRNTPIEWEGAFEILKAAIPGETPAKYSWYLRSKGVPKWLSSNQKAALDLARDEVPYSPAKMQLEEAGWRMQHIREQAPKIIPGGPEYPWEESAKQTTRLDEVLTHPIWGHVILAVVFFTIFQAVYAWAEWPMDWIDGLFGKIHAFADQQLPSTWWKRLLLDGILNGIAGIVVFVPQIMILFGLTSALEATGYMARVGFLGDRLLQRLGLSGRSVVPLVGGMACAVPAVMAARTIQGKRERLITILITPLMTCSARLPVYAFLIGFVVADEKVLGGMFNLQGLFLFGLYVFSTLSALALAWLLHRRLPTKSEGQFTLEWPTYRWPRPVEVGREMITKGWSFVSNAGQVILVISMVLWALGEFGPADSMQALDEQFSEERTPEEQVEWEAAKLEASWLGHFGRWIEPAFKPLGYDGRMGIAIISSFAAREVFVGTMSALFPSADQAESDEGRIRQLQRRLTQEIHPSTGKPLLNTASAVSLILFYMYAMQCMSTVVIVRKELDSWPWAISQAIGFSLFAYGLALLTYQLF